MDTGFSIMLSTTCLVFILILHSACNLPCAVYFGNCMPFVLPVGRDVWILVVVNIGVAVWLLKCIFFIIMILSLSCNPYINLITCSLIVLPCVS